MKKVYIMPDLEEISFQCEDVIAQSGATNLSTSIGGKDAASLGAVSAAEISNLDKLDSAIFGE